VTPQDWEQLLNMLRSTGLDVAGVDYETGTVILRIPNRLR